MPDPEQYKTDEEFRLRKEELELREKELKLEREKATANAAQELRKHSIERYGALAAILAAIGGFLGVYVQGFQSRTLEQQKFEQNLLLEKQKFQTTLIFKAVETGKPEDASRNLLFLVKAGFLEDREHKIADLATDPASTPFLSSAGHEDGYRILDADVDEYCKKTYGKDFHSNGDQCSSGKTLRRVRFADICLGRTGSADFLYDPMSAITRCRNSLVKF